MNKDRNSTKRLVFMKKVRDFFNKQVEKEEKKLERKLTKEERRENRKKNRKMAKSVAMFATTFALGIVGGAEGRHLLDSGHSVKVVEDKDNSKITIDTNETGKHQDVHINNSTKDGRRLFVDGLHIEEDDLETIQKLKQNVHEEINQLEGKPEQILTYIKELYANEYNQKKDTDITSDDISIDRRRMNQRLTEVLMDDGTKQVGRNMEMEITIDNKKCHDKIKIPYTRFENNRPKGHVYSPGAIRLVNSLTVIDMGLDWIDDEAKEGASKGGFERAIIEYKKSQMNDIAIGYDISKGGSNEQSSIAKKEGVKMRDFRNDENEVIDLTKHVDER